MTSLPLIARAYILSLRFKFNYYHLTEKVYDITYQKKSDKIFKNYYYTDGGSSLITKVILYPLVLLMTLFALLSFFHSSRCFLFFYSTLGFSVPEECSIENSDAYYYAVHTSLMMYAQIFELCMFFIEILIFLTFTFNVLKYPIHCDKFKIRTEILIIFLIWAVYHNLVHGYQLYFLQFDVIILFYINLLQNLSFIALYLYLIYARMKIDKNEFLGIIQNFDLFMHNHLCFSFFKEFIKNYHSDCSNYLLFWVDYYIYKQQVKSYGSSAIEMLAMNANSMFQDYFAMCNSSINPQSRYSKHSMNSKNSKNSAFTIEFPVDIQENVEEVILRDSSVDFAVLKELFDDAFLFVNDQLYNIFLLMCQNEEEYLKLEQLISFLDIREIKNQNTLSRKTTLLSR